MRIFTVRNSGLMILLTCACAVGADAPPSIDTYGRLPALEDLALSPDGSRLAFVKTVDDKRLLSVVSLADKKLLGVLGVGDAKLRGLEWADDEDLMIIASVTAAPMDVSGPQREWQTLNVYNLKTGKLRRVDMQVRDQRTMDVILGAPTVRRVSDATILFVRGLYADTSTNRLLPALFRVEAASGRTTIVAKSSEGMGDWLVDDAGNVIAALDYRERDQHWSLKMRRDGRMVETASGREPLDPPRMLGLAPDGASMILRTVEEGQVTLHTVSLQEGTLGAPFEKGRGLGSLFAARRSQQLLGGVVQQGNQTRYAFFDPQLQSRWNEMVAPYAEENVQLVSASDDYSSVVVLTYGSLHGFGYKLWNLRTGDASSVGDAYEGLTRIAEVRFIRYRAADGLMIQGYLTLPRGHVERDLPLVVLPHGGPAQRDTGDFDWWAQALASQGYAVLQPNYRGSALDWRFVSLGFGEWGRKMQRDLSDGVRYLVNQGMVDPKRVCIVGASYGGYAALAGASLENGVYRCAVSVAGISDLKRMLSWVAAKAGRSDGLGSRYWDRFLGVTGPSDPKLGEISPVEHVRETSVPVLLIHGRDDTVVPFEQSQAMADALKRAGKPVELVALKHEDHWLSHSATRLQMLQATSAFLRANNPPDE
jgi:dipeptidyl aminopeptidase/acylaminoacyl peptidase